MQPKSEHPYVHDNDTYPVSQADETLFNLRNLRGAELVAALLTVPWYAMPDDVIGGWCIMPTEAPPSAGGPQIGAFLGEGIARRVAELHNERLRAGRAGAGPGGGR